MVLDLPGEEENIFPHSWKFRQGLGNERVGQATVVVSLDGSGDTDSVQEGIDMLPDTGGVVFIKEGTYNLQEKIILTKSNVEITGTGDGSILKRTDDILEIGDGTNTYVGNKIENIQLDGGQTFGKKGIIIKDRVINLRIRGILFNQIYGGAIEANGAVIRRLIFSENILELCLFTAAKFTSIKDSQIINNIINGSIGVILESCEHVIVNENVWNSGGQLMLDECQRCTANGNNFNDCSTNSLWISNTDYSIFDGNLIYLGDYAGIRATETAEHNIISNNIIKDTELAGGISHGILLDSNTFSNLVDGNIATGSVTGQITDNGANTLSNNITT